MKRSGFSLIELLAALAILIIIVGIMGTIFTESDRAWNLGTGRVTNNNDGRAALDLLKHDLQYAVADSKLSFLARPDKNGLKVYGFPCDELAFVSLQHDSSQAPRTAREIMYFVEQAPTQSGGRTYSKGRYRLVRKDTGQAIFDNPAEHCYYTHAWREDRRGNYDRSVVCDNVAAFAVFASDGSATLTREYDSADYSQPAWSNRLPQYVDIYLEVLNERDALRAAQMADAFGGEEDPKVVSFVEKNVRRYTTRVYFHNRLGYKERK